MHCLPEKLIEMIRKGDPAMRLSLRAELRRVISRIDLDFEIDPEGLSVTVRFVNDATRTVTFLKLMPRRNERRLQAAARAARRRPERSLVGIDDITKQLPRGISA
jgi:hypothetical protein